MTTLDDLKNPDGTYNLNKFDWFVIIKRGDNNLYSVCNAPQHISKNTKALAQAEKEAHKHLKKTTENAIFVFFKELNPKDTMLLVFPCTPEQQQDIETNALNGLHVVGYRSPQRRTFSIKA